jgi:hypothetical protein
MSTHISLIFSVEGYLQRQARHGTTYVCILRSLFRRVWITLSLTLGSPVCVEWSSS